MSFETEQDQFIKQARLYLAPPNTVYEELRRQAERTRTEWFAYDDKKIEPLLVNRNEPLINLGLAAFGANQDVFSALYEHSHVPPENDADTAYKRGLRIGCLTNRILPKIHFLMDFPAALVGAEEMRRLIAFGDDDEVTALVRNPSVADKFLESLYTRAGPFAEIDDERWAKFVILSSKNDRLRTNEDDDSGPDLGHYSIQKAIFRLLEIAPLDLFWVRVLWELLFNLNFRHVHRPESIDGVLNRWASMSDKTRDGKEVVEGYYTKLSLRDEFRCLIAALYGSGFKGGKTVLHGSVKSSDVAVRCAFYAHAEITKKDMQSGYERDESAYLLGVLYNKRIYEKRDLREFFEDEQITFSDFDHKYRQHQKYMGEPRFKATEPPKPDPATKLEAIETSLETATQRLSQLANQVKDLRNLMLIAAIVFAISLYFSRH